MQKISALLRLLIGTLVKATIVAGFLSLCALPLTFGLLQNRSLSDFISPLVCPAQSRLEVRAYHPEPSATNYTCDCLDESGRTVNTAYVLSAFIVWASVAVSLIPFSVLLIALILASMVRRAKRKNIEAKLKEQILAKAIPAQATIIRLEKAGLKNQAESETKTVKLTLNVQHPSRPSYQATTVWEINELAIPQVQPQQVVRIKIDAEHPDRIYPDMDLAEYVE